MPGEQGLVLRRPGRAGVEVLEPVGQRPRARARACSDRPGNETLRLVLLRQRLKLGEGRGGLEVVLLERVGVVPDDALRVRLRRDPVELPADLRVLRPGVSVTRLDVRGGEAQLADLLQYPLLGERRDVAG